MTTQERLRRVQNPQYISLSESALFSEGGEPKLAQDLVWKLMGSAPPEKDEWGLSSFREIWVLFTREGVEPRVLGEEEPEEHHQWLNAFRIVRPSEQFLREYQDDLEAHLKYLFAGDEFIEQKSEILYRITAS